MARSNWASVKFSNPSVLKSSQCGVQPIRHLLALRGDGRLPDTAVLGVATTRDQLHRSQLGHLTADGRVIPAQAIGQLNPVAEVPFAILMDEGFESETYVDVFDGGPIVDAENHYSYKQTLKDRDYLSLNVSRSF